MVFVMLLVCLHPLLSHYRFKQVPQVRTKDFFLLHVLHMKSNSYKGICSQLAKPFHSLSLCVFPIPVVLTKPVNLLTKL